MTDSFTSVNIISWEHTRRCVGRVCQAVGRGLRIVSAYTGRSRGTRALYSLWSQADHQRSIWRVSGADRSWFVCFIRFTPQTTQHNINPLMPHMGAAIKHLVSDRVKLSFVIFYILALWRSTLSVRVPGSQTLQTTTQPVWCSGHQRLKMIGKGFVLFKINSSPSAFYIIKPTCILIHF